MSHIAHSTVTLLHSHWLLVRPCRGQWGNDACFSKNLILAFWAPKNPKGCNTLHRSNVGGQDNSYHSELVWVAGWSYLTRLGKVDLSDFKKSLTWHFQAQECVRMMGCSEPMTSHFFVLISWGRLNAVWGRVVPEYFQGFPNRFRWWVGLIGLVCANPPVPIHSKSEKVCGTAFSVKKNCGKSA